MAMARAGYVTPPILSSSDEEIEADPPADAAGDSDSDTEIYTASQLIARIVKAWQSEKLSPELLHPIEGEIEVIREELVKMEGNLRTLKPTDIRLSIHKMEVKRLRFVVTAYLRTRILKIQEYAFFYWNRLENHKPEDLPFMMKDEIEFTRAYILNTDDVIRSVALNNMPRKFQTFDEFIRPKLRKPANLDRFVFFRSDTNAQFDLFDGNKETETVSIEDGSQYVMRYRPIRKFVLNNEISLI